MHESKPAIVITAAIANNSIILAGLPYSAILFRFLDLRTQITDGDDGSMRRLNAGNGPLADCRWGESPTVAVTKSRMR